MLLILCPHLLTREMLVMVVLIINIRDMPKTMVGTEQSRHSKVRIYFIAPPSYESSCNSLLFQQIYLEHKVENGDKQNTGSMLGTLWGEWGQIEGNLPRLVKSVMALHMFSTLAIHFLCGYAILELGGLGWPTRHMYMTPSLIPHFSHSRVNNEWPSGPKAVSNP